MLWQGRDGDDKPLLLEVNGQDGAEEEEVEEGVGNVVEEEEEVQVEEERPPNPTEGHM